MRVASPQVGNNSSIKVARVELRSPDIALIVRLHKSHVMLGAWEAFHCRVIFELAWSCRLVFLGRCILNLELSAEHRAGPPPERNIKKENKSYFMRGGSVHQRLTARRLILI